MIMSTGIDVFIEGKPAEVLQDFQQIVVCFRKYLDDHDISINFKNAEESEIELFCQALSNNGPAPIRAVVDVSGLETALRIIKDEDEEEEET